MLKITDTDKGYKRMLAALRRSPAHVVAGVPTSADAPKEGAEGKTTLAYVALVHEMGLGVPRRSAIADTVDKNRSKYVKFMARQSVDVLTGRMTQKRAFDRLGLLMAADMKRAISNGISPANAESTIRRKGSSKPLKDTGQYQNSLTHEVRGA